MTKKPTSDTFTFDQLCKAVGLKASTDGAMDLIEHNIEHVFQSSKYAYKEAIEEGLDEEEAEEAMQKAQGDHEAAILDAYFDSAVSTIEDQLSEHFALNLIEVSKKNKKGEYTGERRWQIKPLRTWKESLKLIVETINGVGYFHFDSLREFLNSGPYTEREGCLTHLHYLKDHADVYGGQSLERQFESSLDRSLRNL
jgi:hypothetical protein